MFSVKSMTMFALAAVAAVSPAAAETRMRRPRGERREREEDTPRVRDGMYGDEAGAYGDVAGVYGGDIDTCDFSVADAVAATPDLSTLGIAIEEAGLTEAVSNPSAVLTVLAPTNSAFADLDDDLLAALLANPEALSSILLLHVIDGVAVFSSELKDGMVVATAVGLSLTVGVSDAGVTFTTPEGTVATVIAADIEVCSSVVHIIDTVLI